MSLLCDLVALVGLVLIVVGMGWIYLPLAPIVLGLALLIMGILGARLWVKNGPR